MIYFKRNASNPSYVNYLIGTESYGPEGGFVCSLLFLVFFLFFVLFYLKIKSKFAKQDHIKIVDSLAEYKPSGFSSYSKLSNNFDIGENYDNKDEWKL
jgi:hypothetical protein